MTPDWSDSPEPIPYADPNDPQTLNLYAYVGNNPVSSDDDDGQDFNLACSGANSDTCQGGNQGTTTYSTDANGHTTSSFTATVISGNAGNFMDQNDNSYVGTFNQNGVQFTDASGDTSGAKFISGSASDTMSGSDLFGGFNATFSGNCGGTCVASGQLLSAGGDFGMLESQMLRNPGLDSVDFFHGTFFGWGPQNYRAGNPEGPDPHVVSRPTTEAAGNDEFHYDHVYPYSSPHNFIAHTGSALKSIVKSDRYRDCLARLARTGVCGALVVLASLGAAAQMSASNAFELTLPTRVVSGGSAFAEAFDGDTLYACYWAEVGGKGKARLTVVKLSVSSAKLDAMTEIKGPLPLESRNGYVIGSANGMFVSRDHSQLVCEGFTQGGVHRIWTLATGDLRVLGTVVIPPGKKVLGFSPENEVRILDVQRNPRNSFEVEGAELTALDSRDLGHAISHRQIQFVEPGWERVVAGGDLIWVVDERRARPTLVRFSAYSMADGRLAATKTVDFAEAAAGVPGGPPTPQQPATSIAPLPGYPESAPQLSYFNALGSELVAVVDSPKASPQWSRLVRTGVSIPAPRWSKPFLGCGLLLASFDAETHSAAGTCDRIGPWRDDFDFSAVASSLVVTDLDDLSIIASLPLDRHRDALWAIGGTKQRGYVAALAGPKSIRVVPLARRTGQKPAHSAQGVATKIENGIASRMSLSTAVGGAIGGQVATSGRTLTQAAAEGAAKKACNAASGGGCN